jgi:hypothetical protein
MIHEQWAIRYYNDAAADHANLPQICGPKMQSYFCADP